VADFAPTPLAHAGAMSHQAEPHREGAGLVGSIDYGTYVTGTTGAATGRGVAVDAADNQFVTGLYDNGTTKSSYVKKYRADGTPDPVYPAPTLQVLLGGVTYDTEGHGIAVEPTTGNVDLVGAAFDPRTGNHAAFFAQYNPAGTLINLVIYGNNPNPNSFDGVTVDAAGDVAFTGTLFVDAVGHNELTVGALPAGGSLIVLNYALSGITGNSAGLGIAIDGGGATAYIAGSAVATPGGLQKGLVGRIDRNTPGQITYRPFSSPAGDALSTLSP
jgi:hypothetical protein